MIHKLWNFFFPLPGLKNQLLELVGWLAMASVTFAFFLNTQEIIERDSLTYLNMNFFGSVGLIVICVYKGAYQPALLNVVWTIISFAAIFNVVINNV